MRLEDAGVIGPIGPRSDGLDAPFWSGLAEGRLLIQRCEACGTWIWSPQPCCPHCRRLDPGWQETPARGVVYSWTRTHQPFTPDIEVPYVTVVVELAEAGGRRLVGLLVGDDDTDPVVGEPVEGVIQPPGPRTGEAAVLRWQRPSSP